MDSKNFYCIIMAGGTGRRFWPYSRKALPKQFLDFFGTGQTLLQQTYERYRQILPAENIFITTNQHYKELVLNSLPGFSESNLIVEEEHRNTAPAIAYASYVIQKINPDASIVVAPSDHLILKMDEFKQDILKSLEFASHSDKLLTLGIKPSYPETGYGYIQVSEEKEEDFYKVKTFIEKPLREFAEVFVQSNEFYWNSGIFVWHVKTIMKAFHEMMAEVCPQVECDMPKFSTCPNSSIDYSIMEKADNVYVSLGDFGWSDLGTWGSLYDLSPKDEAGNVALKCKSLIYNSKDNIVVLPDNKLAVIDGLEGYLIAESDNVLLICKKDEEHTIRKYVNDAQIKLGEEYI